jgi:hypothetical protein
LTDNWLWPVKAVETTRAKLASVLKTLAKLARLPDEGGEPTSRLAEAYDLRLRAYQNFRALHELLESSKFELREPLRQKLEETSSAAQRLFLYLLAIIQHRSDLRPAAVPEALRLGSLRFRTKLADELEILAERNVTSDSRPDTDLQRALVELEESLGSQSDALADADVREQVRSRLALYRETVLSVMQMGSLSPQDQKELGL